VNPELREALSDVDAGKLAVLERDGRARDGLRSDDSRSAVPAELVELYKQDAARSAAQSCAAQGAAAAALLAMQPSAALRLPDAAAEPEVLLVHSAPKHSPAAEARRDCSARDAQASSALSLPEPAAEPQEPWAA
jgi:hypothetical protein